MTSNTTIAVSSLLSPSNSNIEPAALQAKEIQTPADNSTPDQTSPFLVTKTDSTETIVIDDDDDDLIILEDKPLPPPQPQLGKVQPKPAKTISKSPSKSPSTAPASTSTSSINTVTTAATSTKKTPTSTTPTTDNTEDSNSKSTEVKPKRKYVRKTPVDDKDTKPKPKAKPKPLNDTKTTQSSPIDGPSQTVTPEIQNLINEEKNSTVSTGTAETENGTSTGTDDKQPKTMPVVAKSTVTQKKQQPEFNKDGTPRQRPGPKPGYKKKEKPSSEGSTSETKTDDDNAKVEVKKSSSSDSIEKVTDGDKDKVQSIKEKKPAKPTTATAVKPIKPATAVKDTKPKKDKEEKPKPKKDTTASAKPKKDTTTQAKAKKDIKPKPTIAASKLAAAAAATETTPAPESTYYEKMNKSLIQPNPSSKIPPPRIVEIASTRAVSPIERLDSLSDATKTKSIALNTTPSFLEEPPKRTEEPIIALHIPLTTSTEKSGSKQVIFNVMKMAEDVYGFNKVHPHSSRLHDLMNLDDDGMDIADDEDEPDEDEELEPEPKIDGRKSQKGKAKVGQYDYNDPFIDDTEALWEDQRASTKDGFFVFYGPLVEENLKIEKADNKVKRSRKRVANTSLAGSQAKKQNSSTTPTPQKPKVRSDLPTLAPKPSKQIAIAPAPAPASNSSKSGTTTPNIKPEAASK